MHVTVRHPHPVSGAGEAPPPRLERLDEMIAAVAQTLADLGREVHRSAETLRDLERQRRADAAASATVHPTDAERSWRDGLAAIRRAAELHEQAARLHDDGGHHERAARERTRAAACHASYARAVAAHPDWDPGEGALPGARRDGAGTASAVRSLPRASGG